jgi:hypothetical protein
MEERRSKVKASKTVQSLVWINSPLALECPVPCKVGTSRLVHLGLPLSIGSLVYKGEDILVL